MSAPKAVIVLSGKRKSGKDYVANLIQERFGCRKCTIMRLSAPLKLQYAKEHDLDFDRLLDASDYKERYRLDMIHWGEERRQQQPDFFCRLATEVPGADNPLWLISDARRPTDLHYFRTSYPQTIAIRVQADDSVREERGFVFTPGVDDAESECALDSVADWDFCLTNNQQQQLQEQLTSLFELLQNRLS